MRVKDFQDIFDRAKGSVRIGDNEAAERLLKVYIKEHPEDRQARLLLGTVFARLNNNEAALDEFLVLTAKNPEDTEALNNLAVVYRKMERFNEALDALEQAIESDPTRAEFHYNLGNIYKELGNLKLASMAYAKVVEIDPSYVPAYNNLGTMYDRLGEWEKAFHAFRKGLHLDQNNPTLHFNYGIALEAMGRLDDAEREYEAALRSRPGWLEPMNNLGIIQFKKGHHGNAMDTFSRILAIDPFNAEARNNMGVVLSDQGRWDEAIKYFRMALEADPTYIKAVVNLERLLENTGDLSDAIIELEKLVKLLPDNAEARSRLAHLYIQMEHFPEAKEQALAALSLDEESVSALRSLGTAQRVLGENEEAKATFERILKLDPGNFIFYLDLADLHFRRKEYPEAEKRLKEYLTRCSDDRHAKLMLGRLYAEMGNRTHALQIFESLSRANPEDAEAIAAAAELHRAAGDTEKALRAADQLVNLQGSRGTTEDLNELSESLDMYESAVQAYSAHTSEMWERNLCVLRDLSIREQDEDSQNLLMNVSVESIGAIDEESENLFVEDSESMQDAPNRGDLIIDDADPMEGFAPRYNAPLEAIGSFPEEDSGSLFPERPNPVPPVPPEPPATPQPPTPPPAYPQPEYPLPPQNAYQSPPVQPQPAAAPQPQMQQAPQPQMPPPAAPQMTPPKPKAPKPIPIPIPIPASEPIVEEDFSEANLTEAPEPEIIIDEAEAQESEELIEDGVQEDEELPSENEEEDLKLEEEAEDFSQTEDEPEEELLLEDDEETIEEAIEGDIPEGVPEEASFEDEESLIEEASEEEKAIQDENDTCLDTLEEAEEEPEEAPEPLHISLVPTKIRRGPASAPENVLDLFKHLKTLTDNLPESAQKSFKSSDIRLKMEYLIDRLEGRQGLLKEAETHAPRITSTAKKKPKPGIVDTLAYMRTLATSLPDKDITQALNRSVEKVIEDLRGDSL